MQYYLSKMLGTRQAYLPGGLRTGAPGEYFGSSKGTYRLLDEKVRYFVAPPVANLANSPVRRPSVSLLNLLTISHR